MQRELADFVNELRTYHIPRRKQTEPSIEGCFRVPDSGCSSADYVPLDAYLEESVNLRLLETIERFQVDTLEKLRAVLENLEQEDWIFP